LRQEEILDVDNGTAASVDRYALDRCHAAARSKEMAQGKMVIRPRALRQHALVRIELPPPVLNRPANEAAERPLREADLTSLRWRANCPFVTQSRHSPSVSLACAPTSWTIDQDLAAVLAMRLQQWLSAALLFLLPFAVLLVLWAVLVPHLNVNPRLFPTLGSVVQAGIESMRDGSLPAHIGAILLRVLMGVSPVVSGFLTPLFRFFSVLAGIAWIPIASLWFGYGFGAITFIIFNAV